MLAFTPLGGSLVSLMPFCSTSTGKIGAGMEVSQSRKSGCALDVSSDSSSTIASMSSIQLLARWQLCRHTQSPLDAACCTIISAMRPCPWPSEIMYSRSPGVQPIFCAKRCSIAVGSAPVVRMKMTGVRQLVSSNTSSSRQGAGSVNALPMVASTYLETANTTFSGRSSLTITSLWNGVGSVSSQPSGSAASCGSSSSAYARHAPFCPRTDSTMPAKPSTCAST
mmetsp:Transcript_27175/g.68387  ORF Transcript_27175/g.68387 Transcript_27175/m.68387 type:complete len:224 (+) Transcript_27175:1700-2371(+)